MENLENYSDALITLLMAYLPKALLAIIVLIAGIWLIKKLVNKLKKTFHKRKVDPSLIPFLSSIINVTLYIMLIISVASMVGVETTSFIAVLGAAGLAIGLALQGSLANFAGGILILLFKPFKVGDVIEAQGVIASVTEIQIFHTVLKSFDNKTIILPNGPLYNNPIINYSTEPTRVVEWIFSVSYSEDIDKVRGIIKNVVFSDDRVLDKDNPYINLSELNERAVNFKVRARVKGADYWDMFFDVTEGVKKAFDKEGISVPYPRSDVHLHQEKQ